MALQSLVALSTITLQTTSTAISFNSIPNGYKDLVLIYDASTDANNRAVRVRCNGVSSQSYPTVIMSGSGSSALWATRTDDTGFVFHYYGDSGTTVNGVPTIVQFIDYAATDKHKTVLSRANNASNGLNATAGRFASTSPITSISIASDTGSFVAGTTAALFGRVG